MKRLFLFLGWFAGLAVAAVAQTEADYTTLRGSSEIMISGGGASNKDADNSFGTFGLSYGSYLTDSLLLAFRQTGTYSNPSNAESAWNGSSKLALDWNIGQGRVRPILGVNAGYVYGEASPETWAAGLEAGLKVYVQPRTFVMALVDYGWFFDRGSAIDDRFDSGQYTWTLGVGFNY